MKSKILNSIMVLSFLFTAGFITGCSEEQKEAANNAASTAAEKTGQAVDATKAAASSAAEAVSETTTDVLETTTEAAEKAVDSTQESANDVVQTLGEAGQEAGAEVIQAAENAKEAAGEAATIIEQNAEDINTNMEQPEDNPGAPAP